MKFFCVNPQGENFELEATDEGAHKLVCIPPSDFDALITYAKKYCR